MKIEERVLEAISSGVQENYIKGMSFICPAIESTARKKFKKDKISGKEYKEFIRNYYFLIEAFIGSGINLDETIFPNIILKTDSDKNIHNPDFADIIYHAYRCSLAHGHEVEEKFIFTTSPSENTSIWGIDLIEGKIHLPEKTLWALIACVVFCNSNSDISTNSVYYLMWGASYFGRSEPYRFDIDVFWGGEDVVRRFLASKNLLRVALKL